MKLSLKEIMERDANKRFPTANLLKYMGLDLNKAKIRHVMTVTGMTRTFVYLTAPNKSIVLLEYLPESDTLYFWPWHFSNWKSIEQFFTKVKYSSTDFRG